MVKIAVGIVAGVRISGFWVLWVEQWMFFVGQGLGSRVLRLVIRHISRGSMVKDPMV